MKYSDPNHPDHIEWITSRRNRFVSIIREGKRTLKLPQEERELIIKLAKLMDKNTKGILEG